MLMKTLGDFFVLSTFVIYSMGATCKLLGILDSNLEQLNIILDNTPTICRSFNKENISQKTCCSYEREKKMITAWNSIKTRTVARTSLISDIIANISLAKNMNPLNDFISTNNTSTNLTTRLLEENFENSKAEYSEFLRLLQTDGGAITDYSKVIEDAKKDLDKHIGDQFLSVQLFEMFKNERTKCWNYYYNTI